MDFHPLSFLPVPPGVIWVRILCCRALGMPAGVEMPRLLQPGVSVSPWGCRGTNTALPAPEPGSAPALLPAKPLLAQQRDLSAESSRRCPWGQPHASHGHKGTTDSSQAGDIFQKKPLRPGL